ncbi:AAA family ATPase [Atopomonas sediminilitoris]|uniref:AAA family ATPase n=1 Tax=Atopomonas sediminilitoris TaxID=2919919 RepID=UPI001F4E0790|nr:AAA family ATPase [Atopomonas sediminilitoris]MCJ8170389.1 AAA family ATPase [Atopomonas sediminilitoris]
MLHADDALLEHYGFSHDPFAARVPGMKFFPAQRKTVLSQLHHLARYSQLMLLVTGPEGSGKTLLRKALAGSANKDSVKSVILNGRSVATPKDLLLHVAQGLGGVSSDLDEVFELIEQVALTGQELYLLIDEADDLADEVLPTLLTLSEGQGQARPHVFLFATAALAARLERLTLEQERFHPIALAPYEYEDTCEYLAQRLKAAGADLDVFNEEQLEQIHEESGGWPGVINRVAHEVAVEAMHEQAEPANAPRGRFPVKHLALLAVVALGVMAAWFMQGRTEPGVASSAPAEIALPPVTPVASVDAESTVGSGSVAQPSIAAVPEAAEGAGVVPQVQFSGQSQPLPLPMTQPAQAVVRDVSPVAAAPVAEPAPKPEPEVVAEPVAQPAPQPVAPVAPVLEKPAVAEVAKPAPAPKPESKPVAAAAKSVAAGSDWYTQQAGSDYALQISALSTEVAAKSVLAKFGGQYHYYRKQVGGKPIFVVTFGRFTSALEAKKAIATLPATFQRNKPWPKRFGDIQREIQASR